MRHCHLIPHIIVGMTGCMEVISQKSATILHGSHKIYVYIAAGQEGVHGWPGHLQQGVADKCPLLYQFLRPHLGANVLPADVSALLQAILQVQKPSSARMLPFQSLI